MKAPEIVSLAVVPPPGAADTLTLANVPEDKRERVLELMQKAREFAKRELSPNTQRAYKTDWKTFADWCVAHGMRAMPAPPGVITLYITDRIDSGAKPSSVTRALAAITKAHVAAGHPSPRAAVAVKSTMAGIVKELKSRPVKKAPLCVPELRQLLGPLGLSDPADVRDRALLLIGFAGGFRRSELIGIDVAHLTKDRQGYIIHLPHSKTDQEGEGRDVCIAYGSNADTCPVRCLDHWLDVSRAKEGPVFRGIRNRRLTGRLSGDDVARIIKKRCRKVGLDARRYSGHSLRSGFVTQAYKSGKKHNSIMKQTGHKSQAIMEGYIQILQQFEDNASSNIGL